MEDTKCDRCGDVKEPLFNQRFWSGSWTETADDGTTATYETLCDDCHSAVVRT
jgi:hypothetical protein